MKSNKFVYHFDDIKVYIMNAVFAGVSRDQTALEVMNKFAPDTCFYKCEPDMIFEFICQIYEMAYMVIENKLYTERSL